MVSRLVSLLTVLSVMITALLAARLIIGTAWAAGLAVVSVLALGAWLGPTPRAGQWRWPEWRSCTRP